MAKKGKKKDVDVGIVRIQEDPVKVQTELLQNEIDRRFDQLNRDHFERLRALQMLTEEKLSALHELLDERQTATNKAVEKAEVSSEKRFDSVNEFRAQQADLITNFPQRSEMQLQLNSLNEKIGINTVAIDKHRDQLASLALSGQFKKEQSVEERAVISQRAIITGLLISATAIIVTIILAFVSLHSGI